mmetsp:Transcript_34093/g.81990  ORF Transcript_34093/g.81990 Transcript_34093/m.81990 type:complete len:413 (-) Transcript_34093:1869-3107(-)
MGTRQSMNDHAGGHHGDDRHGRHDHHSADPLPVTKTILGVSEEELVKLNAEERRDMFLRSSCDDNVYRDHGGGGGGGCFVNSKNGRLFSYGTFSTPTIRELTEKIATLPCKDADGRSIRSKEDRLPVQLTTRSGVDIGALQGNLKTNDFAMVQVASNFNCLENPRRGTPLDSGRFVDKAYLDSTQGPAAVFGTTSSYLYRCHFYGGGQSLGRSTINLLQHTSQYFGVQYGKITLTGNEASIDTAAEIDDIVRDICIGMHADCPVMFGRDTRTLIYNGPVARKFVEYETTRPWSYPLVDHVLSASINLHDYMIGKNQNVKDRSMDILVRTLLRAAYEGAYLAAILRKRKKLYLTLIGGGSFGNPLPIVVDELQRAHRKWANHPSSVLEECVVCLFSQKDELEVRAVLDGQEIS